MDIIYFGYEDNADAYDSIKGYRLDKSDEDNYCSYLIGKGWFEMSTSLIEKLFINLEIGFLFR